MKLLLSLLIISHTQVLSSSIFETLRRVKAGPNRFKLAKLQFSRSEPDEAYFYDATLENIYEQKPCILSINHKRVIESIYSHRAQDNLFSGTLYSSLLSGNTHSNDYHTIQYEHSVPQEIKSELEILQALETFLQTQISLSYQGYTLSLPTPISLRRQATGQKILLHNIIRPIVSDWSFRSSPLGVVSNEGYSPTNASINSSTLLQRKGYSSGKALVFSLGLFALEWCKASVIYAKYPVLEYQYFSATEWRSKLQEVNRSSSATAFPRITSLGMCITPKVVALIKEMLESDETKRLSVLEALEHTQQLLVTSPDSMHFPISSTTTKQLIGMDLSYKPIDVSNVLKHIEERYKSLVFRAFKGKNILNNLRFILRHFYKSNQTTNSLFKILRDVLQTMLYVREHGTPSNVTDILSFDPALVSRLEDNFQNNASKNNDKKGFEQLDYSFSKNMTEEDKESFEQNHFNYAVHSTQTPDSSSLVSLGQDLPNAFALDLSLKKSIFREKPVEIQQPTLHNNPIDTLDLSYSHTVLMLGDILSRVNGCSNEMSEDAADCYLSERETIISSHSEIFREKVVQLLYKLIVDDMDVRQFGPDVERSRHFFVVTMLFELFDLVHWSLFMPDVPKKIEQEAAEYEIILRNEEVEEKQEEEFAHVTLSPKKEDMQPNNTINVEDFLVIEADGMMDQVNTDDSKAHSFNSVVMVDDREGIVTSDFEENECSEQVVSEKENTKNGLKEQQKKPLELLSELTKEIRDPTMDEPRDSLHFSNATKVSQDSIEITIEDTKKLNLPRKKLLTRFRHRESFSSCEEELK